jgi:hypothetical protein
MPRWSLLLLVALLLPGCALVRESSFEEGPEQFQFTVVAGPGAGPAAEAAVSQFGANGDEPIPGSAKLVASVDTPLGKIDIVRLQVMSGGRLFDCEGVFGQTGSSVGCGDVGPGDDPPAGSVIAVTGEGTDNSWSTSTIRVTPEVKTVAGVAEDGTRYSIVPAAGYGYVMWPSVRGNLTLTALDADGAALGTAEALGSGGPAAPAN